LCGGLPKTGAGLSAWRLLRSSRQAAEAREQFFVLLYFCFRGIAEPRAVQLRQPVYRRLVAGAEFIRRGNEAGK